MGIDIFLPPEVAAARLLCLRVAVVATVVLQTLVLIRMPVPSPVSIHRARGGGARIMAHGLF
ncbi:MAG: hypothetical protein PVH30_10580, partial [Desulfobacterales bacterium]